MAGATADNSHSKQTFRISHEGRPRLLTHLRLVAENYVYYIYNLRRIGWQKSTRDWKKNVITNESLSEIRTLFDVSRGMFQSRWTRKTLRPWKPNQWFKMRQQWWWKKTMTKKNWNMIRWKKTTLKKNWMKSQGMEGKPFMESERGCALVVSIYEYTQT